MCMCVCVCARGSGRYPDTRGLRVRSTTTSDDARHRDAVYRGTRCGSISVFISVPSLSFFFSLFRDTRYECTSFSFFFFLFAFSRLSSPRIFSVFIVTRLLFRPRRQLHSRDYMDAIEAASIIVDIPFVLIDKFSSGMMVWIELPESVMCVIKY